MGIAFTGLAIRILLERNGLSFPGEVASHDLTDWMRRDSPAGVGEASVYLIEHRIFPDRSRLLKSLLFYKFTLL